MKQYEYVDEFIRDTHLGLNDTFCYADLNEWMVAQGFHFVDARACLTAHRQTPQKRVCATERVGMGPNSYYRVVGMPGRIAYGAPLREHRQQCSEMVSRWKAEYQFRMKPGVEENAKAASLFRQAEAEINAVATLLHVRLSLGDED